MPGWRDNPDCDFEAYERDRAEATSLTLNQLEDHYQQDVLDAPWEPPC